MDADGTGGDDDIRKDLSCNVSDSTRPNAEAVSGKLAAPASLRLIPASHAWQQTRQPQLGTIGLGRFSAVRATRLPVDWLAGMRHPPCGTESPGIQLQRLVDSYQGWKLGRVNLWQKIARMVMEVNHGARFIRYVHRGLVCTMIYSVDGQEGKGEQDSNSPTGSSWNIRVRGS